MKIKNIDGQLYKLMPVQTVVSSNASHFKNEIRMIIDDFSRLLTAKEMRGLIETEIERVQYEQRNRITG